MDWWSVSVEAHSDGTQGEVAESAVARFTNLTQPYGGYMVADAEPPHWTARVSIEAAGASEAVAEAVRLVTSLVADAGLPGWPVVRATAVREDMIDSDLTGRGAP